MTDPGSRGICFDQVSVHYGERVALRGVSLAVAQGELLALAGPNGSGKSTLLRAAAGVLPLHGGDIRLGDGRSVRLLSPRDRALRLAWMPQEEPVGDNVRVSEFVAYGRYARLSRWAGATATDRTAIRDALEEVDLVSAEGRSVPELSGGERQRARLARTLAQGTPIVLLDEPTAHLDIGHQLDVLERIRRVARRSSRAVVVALHDLNLAARFADRIAVLSHGRLVAEGAPGTVLDSGLLERVWGIVAEVRKDAGSGVPYLIPRLPTERSPPRGASASPGDRVHVMAGGGSAVTLLGRLVEEGYEVSAGILPLFDSDAERAQELGIPASFEVPFAPVGPEALARLDALLAEADAILVAPFPVGPTNLANLERLTASVDQTPVALLAHPAGQTWDYVGGAAEKLVRELTDRGARPLRDLDEALAWLAGLSDARRSAPSASAETNEVERRGP